MSKEDLKEWQRLTEKLSGGHADSFEDVTESYWHFDDERKGESHLYLANERCKLKNGSGDYADLGESGSLHPGPIFTIVSMYMGSSAEHDYLVSNSKRVRRLKAFEESSSEDSSPEEGELSEEGEKDLKTPVKTKAPKSPQAPKKRSKQSNSKEEV